MGGIRIGTLYDFRRLEHKKGIADPQEGIKSVTHNIEFVSDGFGRQIDADALVHYGLLASDAERSGGGFIRNTRLSSIFDSPNIFILCFSRNLSNETMAQFEGADACVEITDHEHFINRITETLYIFCPVRFLGKYDVIYQDRNEVWNGQDWGHSPAVIKEIIFSPQAEIRLLWQPLYRREIEPIIFYDHLLGEYCREVTV